MDRQESTVFAFDGQDFIRTHTTLLTEAGTSAVGTKLGVKVIDEHEFRRLLAGDD